jgi:hypothetical protein
MVGLLLARHRGSTNDARADFSQAEDSTTVKAENDCSRASPCADWIGARFRDGSREHRILFLYRAPVRSEFAVCSM